MSDRLAEIKAEQESLYTAMLPIQKIPRAERTEEQTAKFLELDGEFEEFEEEKREIKSWEGIEAVMAAEADAEEESGGVEVGNGDTDRLSQEQRSELLNARLAYYTGGHTFLQDEQQELLLGQFPEGERREASRIAADGVWLGGTEKPTAVVHAVDKQCDMLTPPTPYT